MALLAQVMACRLWLQAMTPTIVDLSSNISRDSWGSFILLLYSVMVCANKRVHTALLSYNVFAHYLIIIIMQAYLKVLDFSNACHVYSISIIFHVIYGAVCIQCTRSFYDDCDNMCTLSYCNNKIRDMTHLPLFRVRLWNSVMSCLSVYILIKCFLWHSLQKKGFLT